MSYRVQYQAHNGQQESIVFGNENAARTYAKTKKSASVTMVESEAPDAEIRRMSYRKSPPRKKAPKVEVPEMSESLSAFLSALLVKKTLRETT